MELTTDQILDAAIALDKGDDSLAIIIQDNLSRNIEDHPYYIYGACWEASDQIDKITTIKELMAYLQLPLTKDFLLKLHALLLVRLLRNSRY
jgi:hypothetical protein